MKQITEDYVSFETAKLLKKKGFDEPCVSYYAMLGERTKQYFNLDFPNNSDLAYIWTNTEFASAPTHQMALKWLREVHHYYIQIMLDSWACGDRLGYYVVIQKTDSDFEMMLQDAVDEVFYQTYEEACEAALKYTLENLI